MSILLCSLEATETETYSFTPNYSFKNLNINYFDWNHASETESAQGDFSYVGIEGGFGYDNMDFYGFLDIENPTYTYDDDFPHDLRFSALADVDFEIANNWKLHIQDFALNSQSYYVNDFIVGVGYKLNTDFGFWIRPFVGVHHTYDTYYSGVNGYMGGWLLSYDFTLFEYNFNIFQWNEIEFARDKKFYLDADNQPVGDGASWGVNGALSLWLSLTDSFTVGTQYRYADNKLGTQNYLSAIIYTLKYNF